MNYLAHVFLAGQNDDVIFGGLLEDFMHGRVEHPRNDHFSENIKVGIRLHRQIDTLTDTHELVKECKAVFQKELGRYSAITVDVIFDHFLIKNWDLFTDEDFYLFRKRIHCSLEKSRGLMPPDLDKLVTSMIKHDWLKAYAYDYGLEKAFSSLNAKIKNGPDMLQSVPLMYQNYDLLNSLFKAFFTVLQKHCQRYLIENVA